MRNVKKAFAAASNCFLRFSQNNITHSHLRKTISTVQFLFTYSSQCLPASMISRRGPITRAPRQRSSQRSQTPQNGTPGNVFCQGQARLGILLQGEQRNPLVTPDAHSKGSDLEQAPSADADGGCCPSCGRGTSDVGLGNVPDTSPIPDALLSNIFKVRNEAGEAATKYINGHFHSGNHPEWFPLNFTMG